MKCSAEQPGYSKKTNAKAHTKEQFLRVEEQLNVRQILSKNKDVCTFKKLITKNKYTKNVQ